MGLLFFINPNPFLVRSSKAHEPGPNFLKMEPMWPPLFRDLNYLLDLKDGEERRSSRIRLPPPSHPALSIHRLPERTHSAHIMARSLFFGLYRGPWRNRTLGIVTDLCLLHTYRGGDVAASSWCCRANSFNSGTILCPVSHASGSTQGRYVLRTQPRNQSIQTIRVTITPVRSCLRWLVLHACVDI